MRLGQGSSGDFRTGFVCCKIDSLESTRLIAGLRIMLLVLK